MAGQRAGARAAGGGLGRRQPWGERWLLLFTRDRDLDGQTVHEGPGGVRAIPHGRTGELGLRLITED